MMPGMGYPQTGTHQTSEHIDLMGLDNRIVLLSLITAFINAYLCAAVALLTAVYVLANREKRQALLAVPHSRWLLMFFILLFAVPPLYGNWLGLGAGAAICVIFIYYLFLCTVMNAGLYNAVIDISCIISLIYVIVALCQRLLGIAPHSRSPSTFQNANYYSYALELVMMMSFYRLLTTRDWKHRAFLVLVIAANLVALWTAGCRSAWPSIFAGLVVLFALNRNMKSLLALIVVYIAGIKLALSFPTVFPRLTTLEFAEAIRTDIWLDALNCIKSHLLFGAGSMGFFHLTGGPYYHSHDLLLEILVSYGLCGAFFLLSYFGATFYDMAKRYRQSGRSAVKPIYALIFASVAVTVVHGIGDVTVMWPQTGMLLALILAGAAIKPSQGIPERTG